MQTSQNGQTVKKGFPTFGCEGCEDRKQLLTAGDWKIDVAILALILVGAVVIWKVQIT